LCGIEVYREFFDGQIVSSLCEMVERTVRVLVAGSGVRSASVSKIWRSKARASSGRAIPTSQGADGRDHNIRGYAMFMTGAGVKKGFSYGATDELGLEAVEGRMHINDLHATLLALMGIDHEQLTYRYAGRDFRLTNVAGVVQHQVFA
jgi:hypothetical protein